MCILYKVSLNFHDFYDKSINFAKTDFGRVKNYRFLREFLVILHKNTEIA